MSALSAPFYKSLLRSLIPYALSGVFATILSIILGRFLGAHAFGVVAIYMAYVMVLTSVSTLGLTNSSVYLIPKFQKAKQMHHVRVFFLPAALFVLSVAVVCAWIWSEMVDVFLPKSLMHSLIPWMFPVLIVNSFVNIFSGLLYSGRAGHLGALSVEMLPKFLWFVLCVVFYFLCHSAVTEDYILLYVGALVIVTIFQLSALLSYFPPDMWRPKTLEPVPAVFSQTMPFFQSNVWSTFGDWMSLIVVHWVTQEYLIAYYVAANKLVFDTVLKLTNGMRDYTSAELGQGGAEAPEALRQMLRRLARVTWGIVLIYVAIVIVLAKPLMGLWGGDFARYWGLIWIVAVATLMQTLENILTPALNALAPDKVARASIAGTAMMLVLSLLGGYLGGIWGFAICVSVAQTLQSMMLYIYLRRLSPRGLRWVFGC